MCKLLRTILTTEGRTCTQMLWPCLRDEVRRIRKVGLLLSKYACLVCNPTLVHATLLQPDLYEDGARPPQQIKKVQGTSPILILIPRAESQLALTSLQVRCNVIVHDITDVGGERRRGQGGRVCSKFCFSIFSLHTPRGRPTVYIQLPMSSSYLEPLFPCFPNQKEKMDKKAVSDWSRPRMGGAMDGWGCTRAGECLQKQSKSLVPRDGTAKCLKNLWDTLFLIGHVTFRPA